MKERSIVLIIDDDELFCDAVREHLVSQGIEVLAAHTGAEGMQLVKSRPVSVVLLDQRLPDVEGHTLCPAILEHHDQIQIIFITAHPSFEGAIAAIRAGAQDYLSKPFEMEELELAVRRAFKLLDYEKLSRFDAYRRSKDTEQNVLVGDRGLAGVRELVELAAAEAAPVLVTGETGTGKNVAAKAIHYRSPASHEPFVAINCAALPESLIEAELFGHARGAFTGATAARRGIFEMAEGGTLLLDEIGDMPTALQSKLLNVLEDKQVRRVGGESFIPVDVRIIASTSRDLEASVGESFRSDLFYRLSVIRIHLPPLRERREDIPELCAFLLRRSMSRRQRIELEPDELERLKDYDWPGNVRELKNVLERAAILARGGPVRPSALLRKLPARPSTASGQDPVPNAPGEILPLDEIERRHILRALDLCEHNYSRTARALGVALSTLKRKLKKYGLR
ncbi:MAG: sigma-54-dependent Fis family transcriptional regulator [Deltaproteobacteria bacterium]|nr:sigma-54-dependent Fis family transcriptional regulator [Deltaproteobacteria bacterium]